MLSWNCWSRQWPVSFISGGCGEYWVLKPIITHSAQCWEGGVFARIRPSCPTGRPVVRAVHTLHSTHNFISVIKLHGTFLSNTPQTSSLPYITTERIVNRVTKILVMRPWSAFYIGFFVKVMLIVTPGELIITITPDSSSSQLRVYLCLGRSD